MKKKELIQKRRKEWFKYHIPGQTNLHRVKQNAVFISAANSIEHELAKAHKCWLLRKEGKHFITEAVNNKTNLRHDIVCLDTGEIFEIETTKQRAKRFENRKDIEVIMIEDFEDELKMYFAKKAQVV